MEDRREHELIAQQDGGPGNTDMEKVKILNVFFNLVPTIKTSLQESQATETRR